MEAKASILIVEDEKNMREVLRILLEEEGFEVTSAEDGQHGIELLQKRSFDLVITDFKMPRADGFDVLKKTKELSPATVVIMITAFGTTETTIEAMKLGAYDYIHKPFKIDEIRLIVRKALERKRLGEEVAYLRQKVQSTYRLENIIGKSAKMQELFKIIPKVAQSDSTVLITGESGCGKELVAAALHNLSPRSQKNFVTVNCATFPEGLLESELFGHVKGAFTGAVFHKEGLFEVAHEGSIFLDEIAEMPLSLQSKLLRVLESSSFRRVGGVSDVTVDVRIISATNKNLEEVIASGKFRDDLFYRLNVVPISIPPLRERPDDIPLLVEHFLAKYSAGGKRFSPEALRLMIGAQWKGNVRELENVVERLILLTERDIILPEDLPEEIMRKGHDTQAFPYVDRNGIDLEEIIGRIEKEYLLRALETSKGVKTEAARLLGLSFRSFRHRLYKYGIK